MGDAPDYDPQSRVNTFLHVNHEPETRPRYGTPMCVNGTGILNRWLHDVIGGPEGLSYQQMNEEAAAAPVGAEGLTVLPFGNGAERTLGNRDLGASVRGLRFNVHDHAHPLRAAQEGIVFALRYGLNIMRDMGLSVDAIRAARGTGVGGGSTTPPKTPSRNWTLSDTITPRPKQADAYAAAHNRWRRILPHQLNAPSDHD